MNPDDHQFDERFGAGFRELRRTRGACPTAESLNAYLSGSLPAEEHDPIQRHVAACGLCDSLLVRIRGFDADQPSGAPVGWPEIERRMRKRVLPAKRTLWRRLRAVAWHPAFAYALGAAACAFVFFARQRVPAPAFSAEFAQGVNLTVTRSQDPAAPEKFLVLSFWLPTRPGFQYMASLDDAAAKAIVSEDDKGTFHVAYKRQELQAGKHILTITGIDPLTGKNEQSFAFPFEL